MADINLLASQVAARILSIGLVANLNTPQKDTLVNAINGLVRAMGQLTAHDIQYQGTIDGEQTQFVDDALDLLAARKAVFEVTLTQASNGTFTADKTLAQINEAYNGGAALQCVYTNDKKQWDIARLPMTYIRSDFVSFAAFLSPAQGETQFIIVNCVNGTGGDVWHDYSERLTGADVGYSGKVGGNTVSTVAEALDALATGAPLDMSADYAASGAASVQAWATMAKTGDATKYRVAAGRYSISDADGEIGYLITIIDTPGVSYRTIWIASVTDFAFVDCYTALNPGGSVSHAVEFDTESNILEINGQLVTLPAYTAADAGKHLTIGTDGSPEWNNATSGGAETWEKIADVTLSSDISNYTLANFGTYRKVMVMMARSAYVSGLNKNVWLRVSTPQDLSYYTIGYLAAEYGYVRWFAEAEVTDLFATSQKSANNNQNSATNLTTSGVKLLGDTAPSDLSLVLSFTDTSVIQEGDTITVLGVRR